jgi:hypothetical protein
MKQIRTAALSRHVASPFVRLDGLELLQLRKLPHLAFRLFVELLGLDRMNTGRVETSYAVLLALVDFDQVAGAHAADKPTLKRVRTALEALIALHLVRVDRIKNEKSKSLFLRIQPRAVLSASDAGKGRRTGRHEKAAKPASMRPSEESVSEEGQTEGQGIQDLNLSPISPVMHTPTKPPAALADRLAKLPRGAARGGEKRAPKGARPSGLRPTPPGASPPVSPQGDPFPPEQPSPDRRGGILPAPMKRIGAVLP